MRATVFAALAALLVLGGCATTANYEAILATWMGSTEAQLVSAWGPPQNVYQAPDGSRILTYNSDRNVVIPGSAPTYTTQRVGNTYYTNAVGGTAPVNIGLNCQTNMTIVRGVITSWSYQGNDCTAM
jgi:hypothetical protein